MAVARDGPFLASNGRADVLQCPAVTCHLDGSSRVRPRHLLKRLARGALQNVAFSDFVSLVERCGFRLQRTRGGHHIFAHLICRSSSTYRTYGARRSPCPHQKGYPAHLDGRDADCVTGTALLRFDRTDTAKTPASRAILRLLTPQAWVCLHAERRPVARPSVQVGRRCQTAPASSRSLRIAQRRFSCTRSRARHSVQ
jgi:predicted RNA binding protein YcfA (HicA-like mRNA interferase family)